MTEEEVRLALEQIGWFGYIEEKMSEECQENLKKMKVWINGELVQQGEQKDNESNSPRDVD
jgi:hypothetical protein